MKKIIIIDHEPLTIRRKSIFYIEEFLAKGVNLEFWDCSCYFHPGIQIVDTLNDSYVKKVNTFEDIKLLLEKENIANVLFIVEVFDAWRYRKFWRFLIKKHCYIIKQEMYSTANLPISIKEKLLKFLSKSMSCKLKVVFEYILWRMYKKIYNIYPNLRIGSGGYSFFDVHINHKDWEDYKMNTTVVYKDLKYAVFIDEYFPLHPDLLYFYHLNLSNVESYKYLMNRFFDYFEKHYGLEVVIAAHPKSKYAVDDFNGRKVLKYHTPELIKNSEMVLMHSSAALSYVVMSNKPLAIIATNDYLDCQILRFSINRMAHMLRIPIYNIEQAEEIIVHRIDDAIREWYVYNFLTCRGIENTRNFDILFDAYSRL